MSTLSADLNSPSVSACSLPQVSESSLKKLTTFIGKLSTSIGKFFVAVSEAVYEARKEEIRLRAHYRI